MMSKLVVKHELHKNENSKYKKFIFDDNLEIKISQEDECVVQNAASSDKQLEISFEPKQEAVNTRPIKRMIYLPEPQQHSKVVKEGIRLTPNKSYNIYKYLV